MRPARAEVEEAGTVVEEVEEAGTVEEEVVEEAEEEKEEGMVVSGAAVSMTGMRSMIERIRAVAALAELSAVTEGAI